MQEKVPHMSAYRAIFRLTMFNNNTPGYNFTLRYFTLASKGLIFQGIIHSSQLLTKTPIFKHAERAPTPSTHSSYPKPRFGVGTFRIIRNKKEQVERAVLANQVEAIAIAL